MTFVVTGARIFDGTRVIGARDIRVAHGRIAAIESVGSLATDDALDGRDHTLLPGLIDAHIHVRPGLAELAIGFGVTTVLDMGSDPDVMLAYRADVARRRDVADIRSSSWAATPPGGHPAMLVGTLFDRPPPGIATPEAAEAFVDARIAEGADYIKLVIEDGEAFGQEMPVLDTPTTQAIAHAAHNRGRLAVAHVHTRAAAAQAVAAGCDGLMHLWADGAADDALIDAVAAAGMFVVPTLTLIESLAGIAGAEPLARDPRVSARLPEAWRKNLGRAWKLGGAVNFAYAADAASRLHAAGVPLLPGTDSAVLGLVGTAPGASLHRELALLVDVGLTPAEALAAATRVTAERFCLDDRGRIEVGAAADLLLVSGDPTTSVDDALNITAVWRRGDRLPAIVRESAP